MDLQSYELQLLKTEKDLNQKLVQIQSELIRIRIKKSENLSSISRYAQFSMVAPNTELVVERIKNSRFHYDGFRSGKHFFTSKNVHDALTAEYSLSCQGLAFDVNIVARW